MGFSDLFKERATSAVFTSEIGDVIEMEAIFQRIIYENEDFVIASFRDENYEEFVGLGHIPFELKEERAYKLNGIVSEKYSPVTERNERQVQVSALSVLKPIGEKGIIKFLQTLEGINVTAFAIYEEFKENSLEIIKKNPELVADKIKGISVEKAYKLQQQLFEAEDVSEGMMFLLNAEVPLPDSQKLVKKFGEEIIKMVNDNPYCLMRDDAPYPNLGFKSADKIAINNGFDLTNEERIRAGVLFAIENRMMFGHVYSDAAELIHIARKMLAVPDKGIYFSDEDLSVEIEGMILDKILHNDGLKIYRKSIFIKEQQAGEDIVRLSEECSWESKFDIGTTVTQYLDQMGFILEQRQQQAVTDFLKEKGDFCLLNGPAGTGKTFTAKVIVDIYGVLFKEETGRKPLLRLLTPTGKAAKVLKQSTGYPTETIHMAVGVGADEDYAMRDFLDGDLFLFDESGMVDVRILSTVLELIKSGKKVIFMGDTAQLQSIGPGKIFADMLESGVGKRVTLNVAKRQGEESSIYKNSERILNKEMLIADKKSTFLVRSSNGYNDDNIVKVVKHALNRGYSLDDIQLLAPMKKGINGTFYYNHLIQRVFNPEVSGDPQVLNRRFKAQDTQFELFFRKGDKVIQQKNNYQIACMNKIGPANYIPMKETEISGVTNGEMGVIEEIFSMEVENARGKKVVQEVIAVKYDYGYILYDKSKKSNIDHGFAISIHKSQGSQWKIVLFSMQREHFRMLSNELLYTAWTRAQDEVYGFVDMNALHHAINTDTRNVRNTTLVERIQENL